MNEKHYNCIVVFDRDKSHVLFCKRVKDPYKGQYNFVGGKLEPGEHSAHAAYRELEEETGIGRQEIELFHLMDMTYYYQQYVLEIYVGQLHSAVNLVEEANPLEWLSLYENFVDPEKFAGDQNIAHIINVAMKHPLKRNSLGGVALKENVLCIGVDGCRGGWIAAVFDHGELRIEKYPDIAQIISVYPRFDEFLIDMVIGLPSSNSDLRPDSEARKIIVPRTSTIFPVPSRQAVYRDTEADQIAANKEVLGKSLAKQTMALIPKMREIDMFLDENQEYKNQIKESHPEVCFARLNGNVVMSKKSQKDGLEERMKILSQYLPELQIDKILAKSRECRCNADDIMDAICLAITGNLNLQGKGEAIPKNVQEDAKGLRMQMIIPAVPDIAK